MDQPTDLPEGAMVELVPADEESEGELSETEWAALRPLLDRSWTLRGLMPSRGATRRADKPAGRTAA